MNKRSVVKGLIVLSILLLGETDAQIPFKKPDPPKPPIIKDLAKKAKEFQKQSGNAAAHRPFGWPVPKDRNAKGPDVILYLHPDYRGACIYLYKGETIENFEKLVVREKGKWLSFNDKLSSVKVRGGVTVDLWEHAFDDKRRGAGAHWDENKDTRKLPDRLNDIASSCKVH